jgi:4-amino-4-deoxy-L-arabinose transferase-like glycosyltransferase
MRRDPYDKLVLGLLWAALVAAALASRPLLPIDETRYATVAWEMWNGGDYLVPHLNGAVYAHKPPLLFWLISAGWSLFGAHDWVARLVGPLFGLLDLLLVGTIARRLWPEDREGGANAGFALLALPLFALFQSLLMFDTMVMFFVMVAVLGLLAVARSGGGWRGAGLVALGIGGGILAKGPVVLLYVLPVALLAPWWSEQVRGAWRPFAGRVALGVLGGALIGLAWAVPASVLGGPAYREAILWKQTAGRVTESFAHRRPFWFYLALAPLLLFPWSCWSPLRALRERGALCDPGIRLCLAWFLGPLALLSLVSGKQVHYLLPALPAVALVVARLTVAGAPRRRPVLAAAVYAVLVAAVIGVALLRPRWLPPIPALPVARVIAGVLAVAGALALLLRAETNGAVLRRAAAAGVVFLAALHVAAAPALQARYDTAPVGAYLARLQAAGRPILHLNEYHGQFSFTGRLREPLAVLEDGRGLAAWCAAHPDGYVIRYWRKGNQPYGEATEYSRLYRGQTVGIVRAPGAVAPRP